VTNDGVARRACERAEAAPPPYGAEPFFSKLFSQANFSKEFGKVWKKSLEKVWKKVWKPERTPKEHVSSETICPTLSELCFCADVRRYDHVAVYDDDNIKKKQSRLDIVLGLNVTAQCRLRAACAGGYEHNAARIWQAPVVENRPPTMLWQRIWTGNPVGIAIPVTTMVKQQISVRVSIKKKCLNANRMMTMTMMAIFRIFRRYLVTNRAALDILLV
jgi:hypothetical protein